MGSLNIQRGRDQGLQPYNVYRPLCGMKSLTSFQDWPGLFLVFFLHGCLTFNRCCSEVNEPEARSRVAALYASVNVRGDGDGLKGFCDPGH